MARKTAAKKDDSPKAPVLEPRELPESEINVPKDLVDPLITDQGTTLGSRETNPAITDPGSTLDS